MSKESQYKIEKGIEPPARMPVKRGSKYPFAEMDIGDSFFVENPNGGDDVINRIRNAAHRFSSRYSYRFSIRAVTETHDEVEVHGVRTWRSA